MNQTVRLERLASRTSDLGSFELPRGEVPEMANPPDKKPELFGLRSGTVGFDAR